MRFRQLLFVFILSAIAVSAQTPSKVLKQAEKAMGGSKVIQRTSSWIRKGTIRRLEDGAMGRIVMQSSRPNLYNLSFDVGGFEVESGYNGKSGWMRDSKNGLKTLTGDESVDFQAEAAYRNTLWLDAKRERTKLVSGGRTVVGGRPANVVTMSTAKGARINLYFDASKNLLVAEEFEGKDSTRRYEYSDHRAINGVMQPFTMKMVLDGMAYEVIFDDIKQNAQIARSEFDFPNLSGAPLPDIPSLLKELQANEDKVEGLLDTYSYMQRSTSRTAGKDGVLQDKDSETYQLSFYKGYRIRRLIEKNGKALSAKEQEDEDRDAEKRVEEIEKQIAKREAAGGPPSGDERRISIAEVLRASILSNPRRERFRGRDVIVFDFEPNPDFDYKNAKSMLRFFGKTAGAMWIDEKDKQVARLEAFLFESYKVGGGVLAKLKKGASFTLEQERVNDEIWLPATADINLSVRVLLVKGIDVNQMIRSYDYRKFTTEVKDAKVDPIKQD